MADRGAGVARNGRIFQGIGAVVCGSVLALVMLAAGAAAHPLGNFTINHFARINIGANQIRLKFVVDMAEISTIQQLQSAGVADATKPTEQELGSFLDLEQDAYRDGLVLTLDGSRLELKLKQKSISLLPGAGGLNTLRIECAYGAALQKVEPGRTFGLRFEDRNYMNRIGWHEIVVEPAAGVTVFDSSAYGNAVTDELKAYPQDALAAPLDERTAQFSFTGGTVAPTGSRPLLGRDGRQCVTARDRLAELIAVPEITPAIVLVGLLLAAGLGGLHALSPGHGKTVVGAYLVGSRGTARHAAFLGLTVTITHTAGVFALGLVTLAASQYVLPERLFPVLSLVSGLIVVAIGLSLFLKRFRAALPDKFRNARGAADDHPHGHGERHHTEHDHAHAHYYEDAHYHSHVHQEDDLGNEHAHDHHGSEGDDGHAHWHEHGHDHIHKNGQHGHDHSHDHRREHGLNHSRDHGHQHGHEHGRNHIHLHNHTEEPHIHSHGGHSHSHLPPGMDGSRITWRSLLALGISGGLLPCPSALVVMLASISLHRVGYGLLLVIAFSIGLASVLTAIGLLFVYAGRLMKSRSRRRIAWATRLIPVLSAFVITCAGAAICWQALVQAGWNPFSTWRI
jgi:ABC-type nickel/cobalt efflux system permease component RcnA